MTATNESTLVSPHPSAFDESGWSWMPPPPGREALMQRHGLRIARTGGSGPVYEHAVRVREAAYGAAYDVERANVVDECDRHSRIFCAYLHGEPVGTLRHTYASEGPLPCEEFYPETFVSAHRPWLGSATKFAVARGVPGGLEVGRLLLETGWASCLPDGIRVDVIDTYERMVPYYRRLGYLATKLTFTHPKLGGVARVMVFTADSAQRTPFQRLFVGIDHPIPAADLLSHF